MTTTITFRVDGLPKGAPRVRAFVRGKHAGVYTPGQADDWKALIALAARPHLPTTPIESACRVDAAFYFPRPKGHYRTGKHAAELKPDAPIDHTAKPDRDNLDKCVLDVLTQLGFWRDDAQVCEGTIRKAYGDRPGAIITVTPLARPRVEVAVREVECGS
jgi:Holliday junction resolvase RusA-like endonuclease